MSMRDHVTALREFHREDRRGKVNSGEINLLVIVVRGVTAKRYRTRCEYRVCGGEKNKAHIVASSYIEPECSENQHG